LFFRRDDAHLPYFFVTFVFDPVRLIFFFFFGMAHPPFVAPHVRLAVWYLELFYFAQFLPLNEFITRFLLFSFGLPSCSSLCFSLLGLCMIALIGFFSSFVVGKEEYSLPFDEQSLHDLAPP